MKYRIVDPIFLEFLLQPFNSINYEHPRLNIWHKKYASIQISNLKTQAKANHYLETTIFTRLT